MSGANASPIGRSHQEMSGANASPIGRSHQEMSGANASPIGRSHQEMSGAKPVVGIIMGSDSDLPTMQEAVKILKQFEIPYEIGVYSAHRSPHRTAEYVTTAQARGLKLIIAGAGSSAHLAGVTAAETTLPVIGVPVDSSPLSGFDALLSTVQMPPGVPVATMGVGKSGATNAGVFAVQILALTDEVLAAKLKDYKSQLEQTVAEKSKKIQESL
jgi:phosphoribosylaminoimidazole carboxylase PurE protein